MTTNSMETQGTKIALIDDITSGALALTFAASGKTITRASGDFTADGFYVGQRIRTTNAANLGPFTISAVTALVITVSSDDTIVDDSATDTEIVYGDLDLGEIVDFNGPGGSASVIDATHLRSTAREKRMGLPDEGQFSFNMNFVPGDAGQAALWNARANRTRKQYRITWTGTDESSDNYEDTFYAYCLQFQKSGGVDAVVRAAVTLEVDGPVTPVNYAA